jgi:hypothetical protein
MKKVQTQDVSAMNKTIPEFLKSNKKFMDRYNKEKELQDRIKNQIENSHLFFQQLLKELIKIPKIKYYKKINDIHPSDEYNPDFITKNPKFIEIYNKEKEEFTPLTSQDLKRRFSPL